MKKITTLLLGIACVAMSAGATVTINVRTTDNQPPYLFTWGGADNGEWPGTKMSATSTVKTNDGLVWFSQTFDTDAINIIFNDGGDPAIQTDDITGVTGQGYYIFDPEEGEFEDVTSKYYKAADFDPKTLPATVVFVEGKEFAYFVAPTTWTNVIKCWAWNTTTGTNFTGGTWPGTACTLVGNTTDGAPVYQWIGPDIVENDRPSGIIFNNNGSPQTGDLAYVAGGVYNIAGKLVYTVEQGGGGLTGDVNQDGSVNAADVTALYNYILNGDNTFLSTSDVNADNSINAGDVTAVYNIILGL